MPKLAEIKNLILKNTILSATILLSFSSLLFLIATYSYRVKGFEEVVARELTRKVEITAESFLLNLSLEEEGEVQEKLLALLGEVPEIEIASVAVPAHDKFLIIASSSPEKIGQLLKTFQIEEAWEEGRVVGVLERRQVGKGVPKIEPLASFSTKQERIFDGVFPIFEGGGKRGLLLLRFSFADIDAPLAITLAREKQALFLWGILFYPLLLGLGFWANKQTLKASLLKSTSSAKDELLAFAAHELSAPLTNIKGVISVILGEAGGKITERSRKLLERSAISTEQLIALVEDLLTVSRFERGKIEIFPRPTHIEKVYNLCLSQFSKPAVEKGLKLEFHPSEKPLPKLVIDPDKIREVIGNLLSNALKYTEKGAITLSGQVSGKEVVTKVKDTGVGIPKKDLAKLFQRFVRVKTLGQRKVKGTGLGLYISRLIVEAHHGRIWAESEEGKGSTFYFSLPIPKK